MKMKIGLAQYSPVWEDKKANQIKIENLLYNFKEDISLLILPELSLTGFTMHSDKFAESLNGESVLYFKNLATKRAVHVFTGIIERDQDKIFNTLLHINPEGELIGKYRKIHPFSYSRENEFYHRGTKPVITEIDNFKVGLTICYDLRFPELYRFYGKEKVDILINIANWPIARIEHWLLLLRARAVENQSYMVGVNRVGNDPKLSYNGYSSVFDPMGNELLGVADKEGIFSAEIDKEKVNDVRKSLPFLEDIYLI